jgi:para-nitrobenzyl esterase
MKSIAAAIAGALALATIAHAEPARLRVDSGALVGTAEDGVLAFKGVPFAKPPVGDLRWRPPQRISWTGERDATQFALPCPQPTNADGRANGGGVSGATSEDCLYLNVWAPKGAKNAPVMLWLDGGEGTLEPGDLHTDNRT